MWGNRAILTPVVVSLNWICFLVQWKMLEHNGGRKTLTWSTSEFPFGLGQTGEYALDAYLKSNIQRFRQLVDRRARNNWLEGRGYTNRRPSYQERPRRRFVFQAGGLTGKGHSREGRRGRHRASRTAKCPRAKRRENEQVTMAYIVSVRVLVPAPCAPA